MTLLPSPGRGEAAHSKQVAGAILSFLTALAQHHRTATMLVEHGVLEFTAALSDWLLSPQGAGRYPGLLQQFCC